MTNPKQEIEDNDFIEVDEENNKKIINLDVELPVEEVTDLAIKETINALDTNRNVSRNEALFETFDLLIKGNWLPDHIKTKEVAFTMYQMGKELGFKTMQSFHYIIPIKGKLTLSAKAISALMRKGGVAYTVTRYAHFQYVIDGKLTFSPYLLYSRDSEEHDKYCIGRVSEVEAYRTVNGRELKQTVHYTTDDAENAKLITKENWQRMLPDMLTARCVSRLGVVFGSDLLLGLMSTEEYIDTLDDVAYTYEEGNLKIMNNQ
jgi:hypothetical protein